ncbi:copper amine oxidase N-terminal domain-containing protein [Cohnella sp. AR92]|uniref:copper amine oxidase N-terminal domain-containing protein n=1 Tax=Cohnella sp. AR92 TaxID=648716 RepID=UPI000F8F744B|nr:copper amine oxidase N-terminal domain-containing protein [Cohnella sp. AR92]RUS44940.1 copper amine oxidase N-terminal domain-containing protein [Cohnella sp. AR92]
MMKKLLLASMTGLLALTTIVNGASAATETSDIQVILNGKRIAFVDAKPVTDNGRVLVPLRVVSENLGAKVDYSNNVVTITQGSSVVKLTIGSKEATANGKSVTLDSVPNVKNSRVFVPLRFVSEQLGQTVEWSGVDQYVWIGEKTAPEVSTVIKGSPVADYKYLFSKIPADLASDGVNRTKVWDISTNQLPLKILYGFRQEGVSEDPVWDSILYSMKLEVVNNQQYIKIHYSGKGHTGLSLLSDDGIPRTRGKIASMSSKDTDGSYIEYFPVTQIGDEERGDKNWKNYKITNVKYVQVLYDSYSYVFVKNPYYKA